MPLHHCIMYCCHHWRLLLLFVLLLVISSFSTEKKGQYERVNIFRKGKSTCENKKKIIVDVDTSGLGNRLLGLTSSAMLATALNRVIFLRWDRTEACGSTFPELFIHEDDRYYEVSVSNKYQIWYRYLYSKNLLCTFQSCWPWSFFPRYYEQWVHLDNANVSRVSSALLTIWQVYRLLVLKVLKAICIQLLIYRLWSYVWNAYNPTPRDPELFRRMDEECEVIYIYTNQYYAPILFDLPVRTINCWTTLKWLLNHTRTSSELTAGSWF